MKCLSCGREIDLPLCIKGRYFHDDESMVVFLKCPDCEKEHEVYIDLHIAKVVEAR